MQCDVKSYIYVLLRMWGVDNKGVLSGNPDSPQPPTPHLHEITYRLGGSSCCRDGFVQWPKPFF